MAEFAHDQYKLLKKLRKRNLKKSELSNSQLDDIDYLGKNGCIRYEEVSENEDYLHPVDTLIILKPQGKAIYETYVRNKRRWLIPVIISICALIISIFALYKSSQPVKIYINELNTTENIASTNAMIPN